MVVNTAYRPGLQDTSSWGQAFSQGIQVKEAERKRLEAEAAAQKAKDDATEFNPFNRLIAAATAFVASGGNPVAALGAGVTAKDGQLDVAGSAIGGGSQGLMAGMMTPAAPSPGLQPIPGNGVMQSSMNIPNPAVNLQPITSQVSPFESIPQPFMEAGKLVQPEVPLNAHANLVQPMVDQSKILAPIVPGAATLPPAPQPMPQPGMFDGMMDKGGQTLQAMTDPNNLSKTSTMLQALQNPGRGPELLMAMDTLKKQEDSRALATADKKLDRADKERDFGLRERTLTAAEKSAENKLVTETKKITDKKELSQAEKAAQTQLNKILSRVGTAKTDTELDKIYNDATNDPSLKNSAKLGEEAVRAINSRREQIKPPKTSKADDRADFQATSDEAYNSMDTSIDSNPVPVLTGNSISNAVVPAGDYKTNLNAYINGLSTVRERIRSHSKLTTAHKNQLVKKIDALKKEANDKLFELE